jgi:MFS family permease
MLVLMESRSVSAQPQLTLRRIAPSVFLPAGIYEIGNGAIAPVIALTALHLGASPSTAGYMLTLLGVGQVLGDIPSSSLANRLGDRHAMVVAALLAIVAQIACGLASSLAVLGVALVVIGACNATFYLARRSYLVDVAPTAIRARAMSTLGGSHRIGLFVGPFVGAAAISVFGLHAAYFVAVAAAAVVVVLLLVVPDVDAGRRTSAAGRTAASAREVLTAHRHLFLGLGFAVMAVGAIRAGRQTVLPLWAHHIGLSATTTSLVFGIASAVDMALFYPSGLLMDRYGRRVIALPSMIILGVGTILLPLTSGLTLFTLVAMLMSFGNGIGSGIMMTLGADAAPVESRIRFLSTWRVMSDSGNALGPVVVSVVASIATLGAGIMGVGCIGILAAGGLSRWAPQYSPYWRTHRVG